MNLIMNISRPCLAVAAVTILLMVAAACGGGDGDQDQAAPTKVTQENQIVTTVPASRPTIEHEATTTPSPTATSEATEGEAVATSATPRPNVEAEQPTAAPGSAVQESQDVAAKTPDTSAAQEPKPPSTLQETESRTVGGEVGNLAPEFEAVYNWINSPPLSMVELRGQVVLIDFWTYTCVNCIRTFPYLKEWHAKYADKGLVIVGVHTPEFDFEKITDNVVRSAQDYDLAWPIAQDNDFGTWTAYSNRFWPAKYLVDQDGTVRYTHFGEGGYIDTEGQIRSLLSEAGTDLSGVAISDKANPQVDPQAFTADPATRITREIYGGYGRNASTQGTYVHHREYYDGPDRTLVYDDPGDHQNHFMYLQGSWTNGLERLRHARRTENYEDYIALKFVATSVNAVIDPEGGEPFEVQVTIDGRSLLPQEAGADIVIEDGRSFFRVDEARMYEVVALPEFTDHELTLSSNSPDFSFFAFTFGAYTEGP